MIFLPAPHAFKMTNLIIAKDNEPFLFVQVTINTLDLSLSYQIEGDFESGTLLPHLPPYAKHDSKRTIEDIISAFNIVYPAQIKQVTASPALFKIDTLLGECRKSFSLADAMPGSRVRAFDANGMALSVGDAVLCVNDELGGDTGEMRLEMGRAYTVGAIYDRDDLVTPMIIVNEHDGQPVFANRFKRNAC